MKLFCKITSAVLAMMLLFSLCSCSAAKSSIIEVSSDAELEIDDSTEAADYDSTIETGSSDAAQSDAEPAAEAPAEEAPAEEEEDPSVIYPFTVNDTKLGLGMYYADVISALTDCGLTEDTYHGGEFQFSAGRIGVTPLYLEDAGTWVTATGNWDGSGDAYLTLSFIAPLPDGFDTDDEDAALELVKENGRLFGVTLNYVGNAADSLNITEFSFDGQEITAGFTGADADAAAAAAGMESYAGEDYNNYGFIETVDGHDFTSLLISCSYSDSEKTELKYFEFSIDSDEYFMAELY